MEEEDAVARINELLKQWDVRYNIFYRIAKDELSLKTKEAERQLRHGNYKAAAEKISELGNVLDKVHNHFQDLGSIYNQMWDVVSNNISE